MNMGNKDNLKEYMLKEIEIIPRQADNQNLFIVIYKIVDARIVLEK